MTASSFITFPPIQENVLDLTEAVLYIAKNLPANFQLNRTTESKITRL